MNVEIIESPELRLAVVPHRGSYMNISAAFARLGELAGPAGLFARPGAAMIGIYYDDPAVTPEDELRSAAGVTVADGAPLPAGLEERRIPAGTYARTTHIGPYSSLGDTWGAFIRQWLPASDYRPGPGGTYELYVNNPMTAPPEQLHTDLYVSLA